MTMDYARAMATVKASLIRQEPDWSTSSQHVVDGFSEFCSQNRENYLYKKGIFGFQVRRSDSELLEILVREWSSLLPVDQARYCQSENK